MLQLNSGLRYLTVHAAEPDMDPTQFVIAGDSAGATLTSELAGLITNADYATSLGVTPGAREVSAINHVTENFPPTWISDGNGDGLTTT